MYTTYGDFCIHCSMLTTKGLVFMSNHTVDPLHLFCPSPQPPSNDYFVFCIYVFVFAWFCFFI